MNFKIHYETEFTSLTGFLKFSIALALLNPVVSDQIPERFIRYVISSFVLVCAFGLRTA